MHDDARRRPDPRHGRQGAFAAVLGAALLLGTSGTAVQLGPDSLAATTAAAWRAIIGSGCLLGVCAVAGTAPWRYRWRPGLVVAGAVVAGTNQASFFAGIERTGVATATLVLVAAIPVTAGLIDLVAGGERRPSGRWLVGVAIALVGVRLLVGDPGGDNDMVGVALSALAGAAAALVGRIAQRLMEDRPPVVAMTTVVTGAALVMSPVAVAGWSELSGDVSAWVTVGYLGVATMAGAYALWGAALSRLTLAVVAGTGLVEPAFAAVLALVVLGEPLGAAGIAGIVLVLAGVAVGSVARSPAVHRAGLQPQ